MDFNDWTCVNFIWLFLYKFKSVKNGPLNGISKVPSANIDLAQHWPSIGKIFAEDRFSISCRCWNDNSRMHLEANIGPNSGREHLFSAQQRAKSVPNSGFLTFRMVCCGKSDIWRSNVASMGQTLALLLSELDAMVKMAIGLV